MCSTKYEHNETSSLNWEVSGLYHENRVDICMCDTIETAFFICDTHVSKKLVEQVEKIISMK